MKHERRARWAQCYRQAALMLIECAEGINLDDFSGYGCCEALWQMNCLSDGNLFSTDGLVLADRFNDVFCPAEFLGQNRTLYFSRGYARHDSPEALWHRVTSLLLMADMVEAGDVPGLG